MAVYTQVSDQQLQGFLAAYEVGKFLSLTGIAEGVENSNYLLQTDRARYILTLYEKRVAEQDLPFFLGLMTHLAAKGLNAAAPVADRQGNVLGHLCGRPAALISFCVGASKPAPGPRDCAVLGDTLARLHEAAADFRQARPNGLSLAGWQKLADQCADGAARCAPGLAGQIEHELAFLHAYWPTPDALPRGIIHADLFPDNILFTDQKITGVIDFYFSCTDFHAYDLAICLNAWAFDQEGHLLQAHAQALLQAYQQRRALTPAEQQALPILLRGSALRFLLTRLYDWLHRDPAALVTIKNPLEYFEKLRFHQTTNLLDILPMTNTPPTPVHAYTDGACSGNPGPGGWGALLIKGNKKKEICGGAPDTTNNRMEMTAVIEALRALPKGTLVTIFTDSTYVMKGMTEWIEGWKKRGWKNSQKKPVLNKDLWLVLDALASEYKLTWQWVKGHAGNPGNERADALANQGLDKIRKKNKG